MKLTTIATFLLLAVSSCATSTEPLGETPLRLQPGDWEGTWTALDGDDRREVTVTVVDADNGVIEVTGLFEDDGDRQRQVYLREAGEWTFASIVEDPRQADPPDAPARYAWTRIDANRSRVLVWTPVPGRIRDLVEEGRLPGPGPESNADLGPLAPEHFALLMSEEGLGLFEWDDPGIFVRNDE
jgi:hypothetical protein